MTRSRSYQPPQFVIRPVIRCPKCGTENPLGKRWPRGTAPHRQLCGGVDQGDGSVQTRWRCRCGYRFTVVFESEEL